MDWVARFGTPLSLPRPRRHEKLTQRTNRRTQLSTWTWIYIVLSALVGGARRRRGIRAGSASPLYEMNRDWRGHEGISGNRAYREERDSSPEQARVHHDTSSIDFGVAAHGASPALDRRSVPQPRALLMPKGIPGRRGGSRRTRLRVAIGASILLLGGAGAFVAWRQAERDRGAEVSRVAGVSASVAGPTRRPIASTQVDPFASAVASATLRTSPSGERLHFDARRFAPWLIAIALGIIAIALTYRRLGKARPLFDSRYIGEDVPRGAISSTMTGVTRLTALAGAAGIFVAVLFYKSLFWRNLMSDAWIEFYTLVVLLYIFSRFAISLFYRPAKNAYIEPTVAVVVPAFNEEHAIAESLLSLLAVDYDTERFDLIVVNDGSTDGTAAEIERLARDHPRIRPIHFTENRGKRAAMAAGIRASNADVLIFVDSDSVVEPNAVRIIVQPFSDPGVGAVCGHADVMNIDEGWLAKMQAVRYYIAFRVLKGAESVFGAVTCCSGCFAAYRREAILPDLLRWEQQTFLGHPATLGDDRSLTNIVLRHWRVLYESRAVARTIVPATMNKFLHQQIRWKRSWTREGFILSRFAWRKHPVAAASIYTNIVIAFVSPATAMLAIVLHPLLTGVQPFIFLLGLYSVSVMYGLFFQFLVPRRDALWLYALHFVFFYVAVLIWQNYWALLTLTRSHWGTRPTSHHDLAYEDETSLVGQVV